MIKKKKVMYSIIGIAIATTVFTTTAFTNVLTSAGYDNYKKALIKTLTTVENFTFTSKASVSVDGKVTNSNMNEIKTDGINQSSRNSNIYEDGEFEWLNINQKNYSAWKRTNSNKSIERGMDEFEGKWIAQEINGYNSGDVYYNRSSVGMIGTFTPAQVRFYELLADTLTGDAKNYVITNGNNVYINLAENQIPELAHLGLAAMVEANNRYNDEEVIDEQFPISKDIIMKNFSLNGNINDDGYIMDTEISVTLSGKDFNDKVHEIIAKISFSFSNIGNTIPDSLDPATLAEALQNSIEQNKNYDMPAEITAAKELNEEVDKINSDNENSEISTIEESDTTKPVEIEDYTTNQDELNDDSSSINQDELDTNSIEPDESDSDETI